MSSENTPTRQLTRREILGLVGGAAGSVALGGRTGVSAAGQQAATFPKGAVVRTVLKDMPPDALGSGATLFHEHLSLTSPYPYMPKPATPPPPHWSADVESVTREVEAAGQDGVSCLVDGGHADMGRNMDHVRRIAKAASVHIVASGGYYLQSSYPPEISGMSEDDIVATLVRDALKERHGAFGEVGSSDTMTSDERKVLRAVGKAHLRTGLPIFTHNAYVGLRTPPGRGGTRANALEQLDLFESIGVKPASLVIGHLCCLDDIELQKTIAKRGAFVGIDRISFESAQPDTLRLKMVLALIEAGHTRSIVLASDFFDAKLLKKNGGPGLGVAINKFVPMLRKAGVDEATIRTITVDNPRRFLAFVPKGA